MVLELSRKEYEQGQPGSLSHQRFEVTRPD